MRFDLWEFNWPLIMIVVAISATMSYVGDILGKKIGKKRISILHLRPRHTSTVITIFMGMAVALLSLAAAAYSSESVRIAVFGHNIMARQMTALTNEVRTLEDERDLMMFSLDTSQFELSSIRREKEMVETEVAALKEETETLQRGLEELRFGRVIVYQGEMLAQTPVEQDEDGVYNLNETIDELIAASREYLDNKIAELWNPDEGDRGQTGVIVTPEMRSGIESRLRSAQGRKVLRMTAPANVTIGHTLEGVVDIFDSSLVFGEGEVLIQERIIGADRHEDSADILYTMLRRVNTSAVSRGVLPDPITGNVGNLGTLDFYDVVDRIVAENSVFRAVIVTISAAEDIYTEGPVRVSIQVEDEGS